MPAQDYIMLMSVGGFFLIIGLVLIIWGKREEKRYFDYLATRAGDTREFMEHWPPRPQPGALKIGGWITIVIGVVVLIIGVIFWLVG